MLSVYSPAPFDLFIVVGLGVSLALLLWLLLMKPLRMWAVCLVAFLVSAFFLRVLFHFVG